MSQPELKQLIRAEDLFNNGSLNEALEILRNSNHFDGLNSQRKCYYQFLNGLILFFQSKYEELIEFGERISNEDQKLKNYLQTADGYFFIAYGLSQKYKFDDFSIDF